jgi:hypothetical protein
MSIRLVSAFAVLAVSTTSAAESPPLPPQPRQVEIVRLQDLQRPDVPEPPEPPPGANAWSLRVHTSGGFTGRGVGSVMISSDGQLGCGPAPCATPVVTALLEPVGKAITSAVAGAVWASQQPLSTLCSDCIRTTIVLKRREGDVVRLYRASWDDSQSVTPELRDLRQLALEVRSGRSAR